MDRVLLKSLNGFGPEILARRCHKKVRAGFALPSAKKCRWHNQCDTRKPYRTVWQTCDVIDDVMATGATLKAAKTHLLAIGSIRFIV